jgi:N utilization substance protein B
LITFAAALSRINLFEIMLGRRQLREKAMQAIYAWKSAGEDADQRAIEKNMLRGVDQIYDLYIYLLNLLNFQKTIAEHRIGKE